MKFSLKQEIYKLKHQNIFLNGFIILLLLMIYSLFSNKVNLGIIEQNFGSGQWLTIIITTISSTFLAMEYTNNTIITLMYKRPNRSFIYFSKMLVLIAYSFILIISSIIVTFVLKEITVGGKYNWKIILIPLSLNVIGSIIYLIFIITVSLFLISIFKNNALVIGLGLFNSFLGAPLSTAIMDSASGLIPLLKWNPFNMIYVMSQLSAPKNFYQITHLDNTQIIIANIIYIIIFTVLGYIMFKKRKV